MSFLRAAIKEVVCSVARNKYGSERWQRAGETRPDVLKRLDLTEADLERWAWCNPKDSTFIAIPHSLPSGEGVFNQNHVPQDMGNNVPFVEGERRRFHRDSVEKDNVESGKALKSGAARIAIRKSAICREETRGLFLVEHDITAPSPPVNTA